LASPSLLQHVSDALQASGLAPDRLELEITETAMMNDKDRMVAILRDLRTLGVRIALDDFGTGYSALSLLRRFAFDKVKIDRSFAQGLGQEGDSELIMGAIIALCEKLRMATTVEGIETPQQLDLSKRLNGTELQGFLFSRPCPVAEAALSCQTLTLANLPLADQAVLRSRANAA
jgi:EAL domain-containing protein (putative c-di-GMP-specific phosphodiesterase class I)